MINHFLLTSTFVVPRMTIASKKNVCEAIQKLNGAAETGHDLRHLQPYLTPHTVMDNLTLNEATHS